MIDTIVLLKDCQCQVLISLGALILELRRVVLQTGISFVSLSFIDIIRVKGSLGGVDPRLGRLEASDILIVSELHSEVQFAAVRATRGVVSLTDDVIIPGRVAHIVNVHCAGSKGGLATLTALHHSLVL